MGITKRAVELSVNIRMERRHITQIEKYKYLGVVITKDGKCETEALKRIGMANSTFNSMRKTLSIMKNDMKIRMRLVNFFVSSVSLYGCEVWTVGK